jgi:hypothetical protein
MTTFFLDEYHYREKEASLQVRHSLLMGSAMTAMFAGSDTTRASLIAVCSFLCKYPDHQQKRYEELKDIDTTNSTTLAAQPHFNAVIKETLRLSSPTVRGGKRQTRPDGLWINDVYIPQAVQVSASKYVAHHRKCISSIIFCPLAGLTHLQHSRHCFSQSGRIHSRTMVFTTSACQRRKGICSCQCWYVELCSSLTPTLAVIHKVPLSGTF